MGHNLYSNLCCFSDLKQEILIKEKINSSDKSEKSSAVRRGNSFRLATTDGLIDSNKLTASTEEMPSSKLSQQNSTTKSKPPLSSSIIRSSLSRFNCFKTKCSCDKPPTAIRNSLRSKSTCDNTSSARKSQRDKSLCEKAGQISLRDKTVSERAFLPMISNTMRPKNVSDKSAPCNHSHRTLSRTCTD